MAKAFTPHPGSWGSEYIIEYGPPKKVSCKMCEHYCEDKSCNKTNQYVPELGYNYWKFCKHFSLSDNYKSEKNLKQLAAAKKSAEATATTEKDDEKAVPFSGLRNIGMHLLQVPYATKPSKKRLDKMLAYYKEYGELDKPIRVSCSYGKYLLEDGYLRYCVAKQLGLETITAEMGDAEVLKQRNKLRTKGSAVWNLKKQEKGIVTNATIKYTTIRWQSGKTAQYDICVGINTGTLKAL